MLLQLLANPTLSRSNYPSFLFPFRFAGSVVLEMRWIACTAPVPDAPGRPVGAGALWLCGGSVAWLWPSHAACRPRLKDVDDGPHAGIGRRTTESGCGEGVGGQGMYFATDAD